jgi:hypothetical protein
MVSSNPSAVLLLYGYWVTLCCLHRCGQASMHKAIAVTESGGSGAPQYLSLLMVSNSLLTQDINRISGYIPGKIVFFLMQVGACSDMAPTCLLPVVVVLQAWHGHLPAVVMILMQGVGTPQHQVQSSHCCCMAELLYCMWALCLVCNPATIVPDNPPLQVCKAGISQERRIWLTRHGQR